MRKRKDSDRKRAKVEEGREDSTESGPAMGEGGQEEDEEAKRRKEKEKLREWTASGSHGEWCLAHGTRTPV